MLVWSEINDIIEHAIVSCIMIFFFYMVIYFINENTSFVKKIIIIVVIDISLHCFFKYEGINNFIISITVNLKLLTEILFVLILLLLYFYEIYKYIKMYL